VFDGLRWINEELITVCFDVPASKLYHESWAKLGGIERIEINNYNREFSLNLLR
jgi:hypothetical protein